MTSVPDQELLHLWHVTRDAEAFKELTRRYAGLVYSAAKRILRNDYEAEDVTQECFERLATTARPPKGAVAPWMHRVATNRALDRVRTGRNRRQREQRYAAEQEDDASAVDWNEISVLLDEAVDALPEELRGPIVEHFFRNRSGADIASELRITRQAISYRIRKGVEEMRHTLRKRGVASITSASLAACMRAELAEAATVPATLSITLGKLSIAGGVSSKISAAAAAGAYWGGLSIMSKIIVVGAMAIATALGAWNVAGLSAPSETQALNPPREDTSSKELITNPPEPAPVAQKETPSTSDTTTSVATTVVATSSVTTEAASTPAVPKEGASIEGQLVDGEGKPFIGVEVTAYRVEDFGSFFLSYGKTDENGQFLLAGLDEGYCILCATPPERHGHVFAIRVYRVGYLAANEQKKGIRFVLDKGLSISGRVVDQNGAPLWDAELEVKPSTDESADSKTAMEHGMEETSIETDLMGKFLLNGMREGAYEVSVDLDGYGATGVQDIMAGTEDIEIVMTRVRVRVSGQVVDASTHAPLGAFEMCARGGVSHELGPWFRNEDFAHFSGAQGAFDLEVDHSDRAFSLAVRAEGYTPRIEVLRDIASDTISDLLIPLEKGEFVTLDGRVVDASRVPVPNAYVFIGPPPNTGMPSMRTVTVNGVTSITGSTDQWEITAQTRTGEDGTFRIASLSPEDHLVSASVAGAVAGVAEIPSAANGEAWVEIVLPKEGGRIEGTVRAAGKPVPLCSVVAFPVGLIGYVHSHHARADENGRYLLEGLPEFDMKVVVSYYEPATGPWKTLVRLERTVAVESGKNKAVDLEFVGGHSSLECRIMYEGEGTFTYAHIRVITDHENTQIIWNSGEAKDDGAYRLGGLLGGESELQVNIKIDGEYREYIEPIVLPESGALRLDIYIDGKDNLRVEPTDSASRLPSIP